MFTPASTILLVDDDPIVRRSLERMLVEMDFAVHLANDGTDGCAVLEAMRDQAPGLLITDFDMPGCCGDELARFARRRDGQIKLLFISGSPQPVLRATIAEDCNARFLEKPFLRADLLAAMQQLGVRGPAVPAAEPASVPPARPA